MLFGFVLSRSLSNLIGALYPAFKSFQALKSAGEDDDKQWLTYWSVYAFVITFECFFEWLIYWIPFYFEAKIIFLVWLIFNVNTKFGGAHFVYSCYIEPFLESREKVIDEILNQMGLSFLDLSSKKVTTTEQTTESNKDK
ncbi:hypothetical protein C9374_001579 [Naegleria lovaniensis]|uniref:HVA22-like protein n=1 Tax=Naegleria lovaniensis TaxID=51637 RepID=A0AA88GQY5_NAELO|nr:uncharacterized protein C9374_001579 [Naegleria lovaniensis]KAG2387247.1 hypothetical protein C9374_001579 [Naegleria lovaniensis]